MKKKVLALIMAVAMVASALSGFGVVSNQYAAYAAGGDGTGGGTGGGNGGGNGDGGGAGAENTWTAYEACQGELAGVWMTTPDAANIETAGVITKPNTAIHNRVKLCWSADADIVMAFDISGSGSNNFTGEMFMEKAGIYSKLRCTAEDVVVPGEKLNALRVGDRVDNQAIDSRKGSNIQITIPAGTLEAASTYYLSLAADFAVSEGNTTGTRIVFEFTTAAEEAPSTLDTAKLEAMIQECEAVDDSIYTKKSLDDLSAAIADAKAVLEKADATQDEIDANVQFLEAAKAGLELNPKGELGVEIQKAKEVPASIYTKNSYAVYSQAIDEAQAVYDAEGMSGNDYKTAVAKLQAAAEQLVLKKVNLDDIAMEDYTTWQGNDAPSNAIGVYLVAPGAAEGIAVKTAGKIPYKNGSIWYNRLEGDLTDTVTFKLYITGNGINNLSRDGSTTFAFTNLYEDAELSEEVVDEEGRTVLFFDGIEDKEENADYPGFEASSRPGKVMTLHVQNNSLKQDKDYYLVLGEEFKLNGPDRKLVDPIVFRFHYGCSHTYKTTTKAATKTANGKIVTACTNCGTVKSTKTIYHYDSAKLSKTTYAYDGNSKKPGVTVKDYKGNIISDKYYTLTYAKSRKNVGTYSVKITFKGRYSGTVTKYFKINPKATAISSVTAKSKAFGLKWAKKTTQVTGYQIRYSTKSSMDDAKKVTIASNKTVSKTISKLRAGKKYYVQIRTYKTVDGVNYYSSWSTKKSVTTKK